MNYFKFLAFAAAVLGAAIAANNDGLTIAVGGVLMFFDLLIQEAKCAR